MTIDRETIGAFVDGELNEIERRRIEQAIAEDEELARQVEMEARLRAFLGARFDPIAQAPVPERLTAAVHAAATVTPLRPRRSWGAPHWAAIVATLVVGIVAGQTLRPRGDVTGKGGALVASGALGRALEAQLASAQPTNPPVRIGLTFKAQDGAWCRSFTQAALQGIACRTPDGWQLRRTASGPPQTTEYRQAGSGDIAAAVQAMAAVGPLGSSEERRVVRSGWR